MLPVRRTGHAEAIPGARFEFITRMGHDLPRARGRAFCARATARGPTARCSPSAAAQPFLYGLVAVGNENLNFLSLNWADNWLHLGNVLLGLVIALLPVRRRAPAGR